MKVLACVKRVPMTGGRIVLTADGMAIETKHLGFAVSPHEECGVEEAVRIVEAQGGESVVLTLGVAEAEEQLRDAMAIGIDRGILLETDGEEWDPEATAGAIVDAIRTVVAGGTFFHDRMLPLPRVSSDRITWASASVRRALTAREREVLQKLAEGRSNKEVAAALHISVNTVETHRARIMSKLDLHSMGDLVRYAIRNLLISP